MATADTKTFIIECPFCQAKVAAIESGRAERTYWHDAAEEPIGKRVCVGQCPQCHEILVGEANQIRFKDYDAEEDGWSDIVRVFPKPSKTFSSYRIPRAVTQSLFEADRSLQAGAHIAACVMLGRALEALCRDVLEANVDEDAPDKAKPADAAKKPKPRLMLGKGIQQLHEKGVIDERLFKWSQQLAAFRNLAAHPEEISISRSDAEDLQTFASAIVEYVYDLADRYEEFTERVAAREKKKKA